MVVNIYLGILFGQLVVPRRLKAIETLEELVNQDQIQWGVTRGSAIYDLFQQSSPASIYGQVGRRMQTVLSADEGVRRVVDSNWAFIRERSILTFKVSCSDCARSARMGRPLLAAAPPPSCRSPRKLATRQFANNAPLCTAAAAAAAANNPYRWLMSTIGCAPARCSSAARTSSRWASA